MFTYLIWTEKYYSKKDYESFRRFLPYSYKFRLFMCILFTLFAIPIDLVAWPLELVIWLVCTFLDM